MGSIERVISREYAVSKPRASREQAESKPVFNTMICCLGSSSCYMWREWHRASWEGGLCPQGARDSGLFAGNSYRHSTAVVVFPHSSSSRIWRKAVVDNYQGVKVDKQLFCYLIYPFLLLINLLLFLLLIVSTALFHMHHCVCNI